MKQKIIILGQDYSAVFCMANSLIDYDVYIIKRVNKENLLKKAFNRLLIGKDIDKIPKSVKSIKYIYKSTTEKEIIELINQEFQEIDAEKVIIIPTSDYMESVLENNKELLDEKFIFPKTTKNGFDIIKLMNKATQKEFANKSGIDTITEYSISEDIETSNLPKNIEYPVFVKPKLSIKGEKSIMKKCDDEQELKNHLSFVKNKYNCPVLIEKFVKIEKEYAILGCSYEDDIIIPGIIEKIAIAKGKSNGVTLKGKTMSLEKFRDLESKIKKFIKSLEFNGLFDIELYEQDGIIYFNELNLRFGAEGYGITGAGVNLPKLYAKKVFEGSYGIIPAIKEKVFLSDKANLDSFRNRIITWNEYKDNSKNIDFSFIKTQNKIAWLSFSRLELMEKIIRFLKKSDKNE
ncbi:MAG: ATP-grasp domain-containing protein [Bacilli bacterium]|nr:ATP-grasp domain-containing protein [Bacilli bacterium]